MSDSDEQFAEPSYSSRQATGASRATQQPHAGSGSAAVRAPLQPTTALGSSGAGLPPGFALSPSLPHSRAKQPADATVPNPAPRAATGAAAPANTGPRGSESDPAKQQPAAARQQPAASKQQPATGKQQPAASKRQSAAALDAATAGA
ncbi:hypothetical protein AURDEDRAFT_168565, partial [Auricularia subglabra TFB-10046 SS5]